MMKSLITILAVLLSIFDLPVDYVWDRALPPETGNWPEACREGQWPRTLVPIVGFENKLWMIGLGKASNTVWFSDDGLHWNKTRSNAGWGERYGSTQAFFKNRLWLFGGSQIKNSELRNDVWYSDEGTKWMLATPHAEWAPRRWHTTVVFKNKLWTLGGTDNFGIDGSNPHLLNDVWNSDDGIQWTRVTANAAWQPRWGHAALVFDDEMWVIGGRGRNDVWHSSDGVNWKLATSKAEWSTRMGNGGLAFDGKLWIFGGSDDNRWLNDVWFSTDGGHWTLVTDHAPWSPRSTEYSVVFNDKMWLFGGKAQDGGSGDAWRLSIKR